MFAQDNIRNCNENCENASKIGFLKKGLCLYRLGYYRTAEKLFRSAHEGSTGEDVDDCVFSLSNDDLIIKIHIESCFMYGMCQMRLEKRESAKETFQTVLNLCQASNHQCWKGKTSIAGIA